MANQHYKIIVNPIMEIDGESYVASVYNLNLEQLLIQNAGKEIYIV